MIDFLDFQKTYVLRDIDRSSGRISSYLGMFNMNITDIEEIKLRGDTLYAHTAGERLYFMPGCTVPRIKVREFCAKNGGTIVKEPGRATIIFYSEDTVKELFECSPSQCYRMSRSHYLKWLKIAYENVDSTAHGDMLNTFYKKESALVLQSQSPFVIIDNRNYVKSIVLGEMSCSWLGHVVNSGIPPEHVVESTGLLVKEGMDDKVVFVDSPLLCHQNAIVKHINVIEIDDDMYVELSKMLDSDDEHNTTLAMEIMANCNYDRSLPYLMALMKFHSVDIVANKAYNHVNFQTLTKYVDTPGSADWRKRSLDDMATILRNKGQNTRENRDILFRLLAPSAFEDEIFTENTDETGEEGTFEIFPEDDGVEIMEDSE